MTTHAVGIDLGTTNSCIAVYRHNKVEVIANDQGLRTTPSCVTYLNDEVLVGNESRSLTNTHSACTVFDAKRLIGRRFDDSAVQSDIKHMPFEVINNNNTPTIKINNQLITPEQVSATILSRLKKTAEDYLDHPVTKAVITVPAYFNDSQRQATVAAADIAGLEVLRLINEPTSASIAYGFNKNFDVNDQNILVFDLGGGTFDVTLLSMDEGVAEVLATSGDTRLGGEDLDSLLVVHCLKQFVTKNKNIDQAKLMNNTKSIRRLRSACEEAKKQLSSNTTASIEVESMYDGLDLVVKLTRARFEDICRKSLDKCKKPVEQVLKDSNTTVHDVDEVVIVGGSTRIPYIQNMLKKMFNKELNSSINPDEAVAVGAAFWAHQLSNKHSQSEDIVLVDVTPLSLGVETTGGVMANIIDRNTTIPCKKEHIFSTFSDNQPSVSIKIYEGERKKVSKNNLLGTFVLNGVPAMPRAAPRIRVVFELDVNGILQVSASEESSGKSHKMTISNKERFSSDAIKNIVSTAEKFSKEDKEECDQIVAYHSFLNYLQELRNTSVSEQVKSRLSEDDYKALIKIISEASGMDKDSSAQEFASKRSGVEDNVRVLLGKMYQQDDGDYKVEVVKKIDEEAEDVLPLSYQK